MSVIAIAVPSLNQGRFLAAALDSLRSRRPHGPRRGARRRIDRRVGECHRGARRHRSRSAQRRPTPARPPPSTRAWRADRAASRRRGRRLAERRRCVPAGRPRSLAQALDGHPDWVGGFRPRGARRRRRARSPTRLRHAPFDPARFARWLHDLPAGHAGASRGLGAVARTRRLARHVLRLRPVVAPVAPRPDRLSSTSASRRRAITARPRPGRGGARYFAEATAHRPPRDRPRAVALVHQRSARAPGRLRGRPASRTSGRLRRRRVARCGVPARIGLRGGAVAI